jgi:hypothetical protein
MAERGLHKTMVAGSTPAPGTMPSKLEIAYKNITRKYSRDGLPIPVKFEYIQELTTSVDLVPKKEAEFIEEVVNEAAQVRTPNTAASTSPN